MLALTRVRWPATSNGSSSASMIRWATVLATSPHPAPASTSTANSSPPSRATRSRAATQRFRRLLTSTSSRSPASCPKPSLTVLKSSRSMNSTNVPRLPAPFRAMEPLTRSLRCPLFASPVSESWKARWISSSSSDLRSSTTRWLITTPSTVGSSSRLVTVVSTQRQVPRESSSRSSTVWDCVGSAMTARPAASAAGRCCGCTKSWPGMPSRYPAGQPRIRSTAGDSYFSRPSQSITVIMSVARCTSAAKRCSPSLRTPAGVAPGGDRRRAPTREATSAPLRTKNSPWATQPPTAREAPVAVAAGSSGPARTVAVSPATSAPRGPKRSAATKTGTQNKSGAAAVAPPSTSASIHETRNSTTTTTRASGAERSARLSQPITRTDPAPGVWRSAVLIALCRRSCRAA